MPFGGLLYTFPEHQYFGFDFMPGVSVFGEFFSSFE